MLGINSDRLFCDVIKSLKKTWSAADISIRNALP